MLMKLAPCSRTCSCGPVGIPNTGESNSVFIDGCYLGPSVTDQIFFLGCHVGHIYNMLSIYDAVTHSHTSHLLIEWCVAHIHVSLQPQACMLCIAEWFDPLQRIAGRFDPLHRCLLASWFRWRANNQYSTVLPPHLQTMLPKLCSCLQIRIWSKGQRLGQLWNIYIYLNDRLIAS